LSSGAADAHLISACRGDFLAQLFRFRSNCRQVEADVTDRCEEPGGLKQAGRRDDPGRYQGRSPQSQDCLHGKDPVPLGSI
jgi:hypothetical protein